LRFDFQDYYLERGTEYQLAPRLGIAYQATNSLRLRMSLGRFYQPEGIQELQVLDGIERYFKPQRSDQAIAGLEWSHNQWQLVLDAWYKDYEDPKGRFENIFNPFVLLPEMESDRLGLLPGDARAYGVDLDFRYELGPSVTAQLRYSYMEAEDKLDGRWIDRRWSQEHTVNSSLVWQREDFSLGLALLWHSGWRSTLLPGFIPEDTTIDPFDYLNNTELRDHFSIDVSARYGWTFPRARLEIYADISNITDRSNEAGVDFDEEEVDGGFLLEPDRETLLDTVVSLGVTLSF
jgi:outer membrane receptor protein involved in Fe transport